MYFLMMNLFHKYLYTAVTITLFLFVAQVMANALLVRTQECWRMCQRLMESQFLRVLIPRAVSVPEMYISVLLK